MFKLRSAIFFKFLGHIFLKNQTKKFKKLLQNNHILFKSNKYQMPKEAKEMLVLAEDHRFYRHGGVDLIAIIRAIISTFIFRKIQGGSTIEQQLVRVITGNYQRTLKRKLKEIIFASFLSSYMTKDDVLCLYLDMAYFGYKMNGFQNAINKFGHSKPINDRQIALIIARLKYPEPANYNKSKFEKISRRGDYIYQRYLQLQFKDRKNESKTSSVPLDRSGDLEQKLGKIRAIPILLVY